MMKISDEHLITQVASGSTAALEQLYHRFAKRILNYVFRMLGGDESTAQDILQDVFMTIIKNASEFDSAFPASAWIFTIARNKCKNEFRTVQRKQNITDSYNAEVDLNSPSIESDIDHNDFKGALFMELKQIAPDLRSLFLLRFQENLSIKEISQIAKVPEGTVKSRLHYLTHRLRQKLKIYNPELIRQEY